MTKRFRIIAIVALTLALFSGTVSAYDGDGELKQIIVEDNGETKTYESRANTVSDFFQDRNITLLDKDSVDKSMKYYLQDKDTLVIKRALSIIVNVDGVPSIVRTNGETIKDVIDEFTDEVIPSGAVLQNADKNDRLTNNMTLYFLAPQTKTVKVTETYPFETEYKDSDELKEGTEKIISAGINGEYEVTYEDVYIGDEKVDSKEVSREVVKEPVKQISQRGTAQMVSTSSGDFKYSKKMDVKATGYTPYDEGCNGVTASGMAAKRGVIAVDTKVIPLGTKVYIPNYGVAIAADTGGAIKGNKIDLCYDTKNEAFSWGVRNITIYILD